MSAIRCFVIREAGKARAGIAACYLESTQCASLYKLWRTCPDRCNGITLPHRLIRGCKLPKNLCLAPGVPDGVGSALRQLTL